jgi:transposase
LDKDAEIAKLRAENKELKERIIALEKLVQDLQAQLRQFIVKKNSSNSSMPPSTDLTRKSESLRTPSGKKPGGQKGHVGSTLTMTETPDEINKIIPDYCNKCGNELTEIEAHFESKRQVVEIPPIEPIYIEFQSYSKTCICGHKQVGDYPSGVTNHIQYGASVEAIIGYQSVYQFTPFKRLHELFKHYFHLPISQGSIDNILKRLSAKALPIYHVIKGRIEYSKRVGTDETGAKINGKKAWVWTWQNVWATFISISLSRGQVTIQKLFPNGFINAILNSDRWRAQINTFAKGHQLCTSHLFRELKYLIQLEKTTWAENLKQLLLKAIELKKKCAEYARDNPLVVEIESAMDLLLSETIEKNKSPKTLNLQESLTEYRDYIFPFLYYAEVPPDNNGSERAIRNIKVKQKVSGQFKTGQEAFCILRSVIDTCKKNNMDVFEALKLIAQMPILPAV